MECVRLRVKDIDFEYHQLIVRDGKGEKDRVALLPERVVPPLKLQLARVRQIYETDLKNGYGEVYLPPALGRKLSVDPRSGQVRRHHIAESGLQRAVKKAIVQSGIPKLESCHLLRHSFATHLYPVR